jgi:hypothetical protein
MSGLSIALYKECRRVLLQCREFGSSRDLRTVFAPEPLCIFRVGLPEADSPSELVDRTLDYLVKQRLTGGRPILPIFLAALRDRYETGDAISDELYLLECKVEHALSQADTAVLSRDQCGPQMLDLLLRLNFREQVRTFQQMMQYHQVASFLVHGPPEHRQQLLVNRLIRLVPDWQVGPPISLNLMSAGLGLSSQSLWRSTASRVALPPTALPKQIAAKVCEWWQTRSVIFVFHAVDYIGPSLLSSWIHDFWQLVVSEANCTPRSVRKDTYLLMFIVDYQGIVAEWEITLTRQPDQFGYSGIPVCLPGIGKFDEATLDSWIGFGAEFLPAGISAHALLDVSDCGIPQRIYDAVCDRYALSLEGDLARWLV